MPDAAAVRTAPDRPGLDRDRACKLNGMVMSTTASNVEAMVGEIARAALAAARQLAAAPTRVKNAALRTLASRLDEAGTRTRLDEANARDLAAGAAAGLSPALLDRLRLTPARIAAMAEGVRQVADLPDPVGTELASHRHPQGFLIRKVRVPIGVIGIIYESRPNVTIDCAALCLKSGNACVLRGGSEAFHSNTALAELVAGALAAHGLPAAAATLVPTTERAALNALLRLDAYIHCIIPRGGEGLIRFVSEHARMPVIRHYKGVCNVYLDRATDPELAVRVTVNAKCQRPGVCNAAENLVVHRDLLDTVFPAVARALAAEDVELRVDAAAAAALDRAGGIPHVPATAADYDEEYLAKIIAVQTVDDLAAAIAFINTHGSAHSDAILTTDAAAARRFQNEVDSATVYWNVSTRFTDGFEFGLGAEIGISTDRLHARGPMGLAELTTYKYLIDGEGQVRGG
jgi:glutamate-5-semialdehyde dehydrogenase